MFAHTSNAKTKRFFSYGQAPKTSGVDAFAQSWVEELAWACPPVHLIADTIKRVECTKMMAIIVIPAWKTATFWNTAFPNGQHAVTACKAVTLFRPHVVRGRFCQNKVMQGRTSFPFLAMYFRSDGSGHTHICGPVKCPEEAKQ